MTREPEEPPARAFRRYLAEVECDPKQQARQERIRRAGGRPFNPWRDWPAIGLSLVVLLLLARWVAGLIGLA